MKRGFTLIELLVVIAIIAILAAILFPVFAMAKEAAKKSQALSNTKQVALGLTMYLPDYDSCYPIMTELDPNGNSYFNYGVATPQGWDYNGYYERWDEIVWSNSIQPYVKNYEVETGPGLKVFHGLIPGAGTPRRKYWNTSLSANGLLSTLSESQVAMPSKLTLVWWGNMQEEIEGYSFTNPVLYCYPRNGTAANPIRTCRFNPGGPPQIGGVLNGGAGDISYAPYDPNNDSAWVHGKGMTFVSCDSSAKWRPMNPGGQATATGAMYRSYGDPTMTYGVKPGQQLRYHRCVSGTGTPQYLSFFRPDSEFDYQFGQGANVQCKQ